MNIVSFIRSPGKGTLMAEDLASQVRELIGSFVPGGSREVKSTDRMVEDLGFDSVTTLELALALEVEFDLQDVAEEQAVDLVTVSDIEALVAQLSTTEPSVQK